MVHDLCARVHASSETRNATCCRVAAAQTEILIMHSASFIDDCAHWLWFTKSENASARVKDTCGLRVWVWLQ